MDEKKFIWDTKTTISGGWVFEKLKDKKQKQEREQSVSIPSGGVTNLMPTKSTTQLREQWQGNAGTGMSKQLQSQAHTFASQPYPCPAEQIEYHRSVIALTILEIIILSMFPMPKSTF